jgi:hypothetical protein
VLRWAMGCSGRIDTDVPQLGVGGQGGVELAGQLDRVWFLDRAVCLDFAGVGVDE